MFSLDPQLRNDANVLGSFPLCNLLLINDAQYPWFVLVPRRANITEIVQLSPKDRIQLLEESCQLQECLLSAFQPDKLNVAALGNMVSQLHLHHIARFRKDAAWPAPVWGKHPAMPYTDAQLAARLEALRPYLPDSFAWGEDDD
ncbi:HIT domain-containing protein [Halopseudomonas salegens]|uniref:HIT domain-containing protein n=1 Tax=Halopseudomonas salegens TaxID=1434072 RepID=UPI0018D490A0|nr:HIT domain-containing protein [Halopseudomonas salegens]